MTDETFREKLRGRLKGSSAIIDRFLSICHYKSGQYDSDEDFASLNAWLNEVENTQCHLYVQSDGHYVCHKNRLFYFAIPPSQFTVVAKSIYGTPSPPLSRRHLHGQRGLPAHRGGEAVRSRLQQQQGAEQLPAEPLPRDVHLRSPSLSPPPQRIDHYLGKELVQNLLVARFSNVIINAVWNAQFIDNVQIVFKETLGVDGRGGYFDNYGIIRDVMQNHLLQIVSLISMEQPLSLHSNDIRDEKVRVLKAIEPLRLEDTVVGQYVANETQPGYLDDPTVPKDSVTATFAATVL